MNFSDRALRGDRRRGTWLLAAVVVVSSTFLSPAEPPPRIVHAVAADRQLRLEWTATSGALSYEVQSAAALPTAAWLPVLSTTGTNATLPLTQAGEFFRVAATTGEPIPEARRVAILSSIIAKADALPATDPAQDNQELARFLSGIPELRDVLVSADGCVWGQFLDGRQLTLVRNRPSNDQEPQLPPSLAQPEPSSGESAMATAGRVSLQATSSFRIPKSSKAFLLTHHSLGNQIYHPLNWQSTPEMKSWFSDKGYETTEGDSTLAALSGVRDAGVFYYEGHSAFRPDKKKFILVTASTLSEPVSAEFQEDLQYALILQPRAHTKAYYSITPDFIRKHMSFSADSLVFINGCTTATPEANELHQAFFGQGASVFVGWTDSAGDFASWRAARYLFDRLLGANRSFHLLRSPDFREDPPQRPFDLVSVVRAMQNHAIPLDQTQASGRPVAQLAFLGNPSASTRFNLLVPSLERMRVDESKEELQIVGLFDPEMPAEVVVSDGQSFDIKNSTPVSGRQLFSPLAADGHPSAGRVSVLQDGRQGNTVPLSEWRVKGRLVRYFSVGQEQPSATYEFNLHFRTDVHSARQVPHGPSIFSGNSAQAAKDSTCRLVDASGIYHDPDDPVEDPALKRTVEWQLPAPLDIPIRFDNTSPLRASGSLAIQASGDINVVAAAAARDGILWIEKRLGQTSTSNFDPLTRGFSPTGKNGTMDLGSYTIQSGQGPAAGDSGKITWESASPLFPPDKSSPGYGE